MKPSMIFWTMVHARQKDTVGGSVTVTTTASTPPPPLISWAPPAEVQPFDRLVTLVARTGEATEAEADALCAGTPRDKLVARGAAVATPRVAADGLRIFGRACLFFQGAPKDLVALVRLSPDVVRIGAWTALEAERRDEAGRAQRAEKRAAKSATATVAGAEEQAAGARADQLRVLLLNVAGDDVHTATRIKNAAQPAAEGHTETSRGRVLAALVDEGAKLLTSEAPGVVTRRALFRLDQGYLDGCAAAAERARMAARAAEAPAVQQGRSQADVDLWDGRAMVVADMVVTAFATAHAIDARVPKLAYVALRDRSGDKRKGPPKKKDAEAAKKDAETAKKDPAKPDA